METPSFDNRESITLSSTAPHLGQRIVEKALSTTFLPQDMVESTQNRALFFLNPNRPPERAIANRLLHLTSSRKARRPLLLFLARFELENDFSVFEFQVGGKRPSFF